MNYLNKKIKEADELAARHWERAASDRAEAYQKWLNCLKEATIAIKRSQSSTKNNK